MIMVSLMELDVKSQHTHAHALLRECLKKRNIRYDEGTPLVKGRLGKPSLAEHPDVHFNLSHAKGIAACVVSDSVCGIDCEAVRPYRENVVRRAFSEEEQQLLALSQTVGALAQAAGTQLLFQLFHGFTSLNENAPLRFIENALSLPQMTQSSTDMPIAPSFSHSIHRSAKSPSSGTGGLLG